MSVAITTVVRDASHLGGGMANVANPLHGLLRAAGLDAHFVSGNAADGVTDESYSVGMSGYGFHLLPPGVMASVVHIHGLWTPFEYRAFREAKRRRAVVVMSPHGTLEPLAFAHKRFKKCIAWWLYQKRILQAADLLVVNSPQEAASLRDLGLKLPIAIIPNGVDLRGLSLELAADERDRKSVV